MAMGAEIVEPGEEFEWSLSKTRPRWPPRPGAAAAAAADRADRARRLLLHQGAGLPLRRGAHDAGRRTNAARRDAADERHRPGHGVRVGAQHERAFVDSGVYMFHRNRSRCSQRPSQIRVTTSTGRPARRSARSPTGSRDVTPLTADPGLQVRLRRRLQAPAAALRALRGDRAAVPADRRDRAAAEPDGRLPAQGAGDDRRHRTGSAVAVTSAAWGHEGGNGITVEMVNRPGNDLPLAVEVNGKAVRVLLAKNATGAPRQHGGAGRGRDRGGLAGPDRPRAPLPHHRGHRHRAGDDDADRPHRLPRPEAHRRARGRGPARPVHGARAADRQAPRRLQAGRADPGVRPRPRVGADDDHARDRRAARAQLRRPTRPRATSSTTPTSS